MHMATLRKSPRLFGLGVSVVWVAPAAPSHSCRTNLSSAGGASDQTMGMSLASAYTRSARMQSSRSAVLSSTRSDGI